MGEGKRGFTVFEDQATPRLLGVSSVEAAGRTHPVAEINAYEAIGFDVFMCMSIAVEEVTKIANAPDAIPWVKQTRCVDHEGSRRHPDLLEVIERPVEPVSRGGCRDERETAIREWQVFSGSSHKGQIGHLTRGRFRCAPHTRTRLDEVVARLIHSGDLQRQVQLKRAEAARRNAIADEVLADWLPVVSSAPGFHRWLPIPAARTLIALVAQAAQASITLAPPGALQQVDRGTLGVRICLGHPATGDDLKRALLQLRRILQSAEELSFV
nr:hypothetical protein [Bradyrhizobium elkanii]